MSAAGQREGDGAHAIVTPEATIATNNERARCAQLVAFYDYYGRSRSNNDRIERRRFGQTKLPIGMFQAWPVVQRHAILVGVAVQGNRPETVGNLPLE